MQYRRFNCGFYVECQPGAFVPYVIDEWGNLTPGEWYGAALHFGDRWDTEPYLAPE